MSLTIKQEIFVQRLIEKDSQRQAYKFAYDCDNMKDETVDRKASDLFKKAEVRARFDELKEELRKQCFYTVEKANDDLEWIKAKAKEDIEYKGLKQANSGAFLNAIKQQVDLNGLSFKDATDYELKKLRLELDKKKLEGPGDEEYESDGLIEALEVKAGEVWQD